ncbi:hypothetical protein M885DRAFT_463044 [Pelagophyceae sp. CCMP2097]|nr:hypothetical protein M885DRAFT_463044 [Pelagophyceae sp. CCMP2097]
MFVLSAVLLLHAARGFEVRQPRAAAARGGNRAPAAKCAAPTQRRGRVVVLSAANDDAEVEALKAQAEALRREVEVLTAEAAAESLVLKAAEAERLKNEPPKASVVAADARRAERKAVVPKEPEKKSFLDGLFASSGEDKPAPQASDDDVSAAVRALACLPYLLPLSDALPFGNFFFNDFPVAGIIVAPAVPALALINAIPFGGFIAFLALSQLSRNQDIPRFTRFSMQQAVLLDIALIFPQLLGSLASATGSKMPEALIEPASTTVFLAILLSVLYSVASNAQGKMPNQIPIVSDAANNAIGM